MKWFKHESSASLDAKLQTVLLDYGLEGYGLYWYCLELISGNVTPENLTFELEHDARIIARNTGSTVQKVEEMMSQFIDLGLFEASNGVVKCLKLAKKTDEYTAKLLSKSRHTPDELLTVSGQNPEKSDLLEQKRIEKKRKEEIKNRFGTFWKIYPNKQGKTKALAAWIKHIDSVELADSVTQHIKTRAVSDQQWLKDGGQYIPLPTTFLNQCRWEDEYKTSSSQTMSQQTNQPRPNRRPVPKAGTER